MSTQDQFSDQERSSEETPTLTSAEPTAATGDPHREHPNSSRAGTDPSIAPPGQQTSTGRAGDGSTAESQAEPSSQPSLFAEDELAGLRARWDSVQAGFVDDPRECVQRADRLVADVVGQLTAGFTDARSRLEDQWGRGEEVSTEDLRVALTRYRDFFERLLAV